MSSTSSRYTLYVWLLLLVILPLAACGSEAETSAETAEAAGAVAPGDDAPALPPVNVAIMTLAPSELHERIELSGRMEPWVEVQVSTELGGAVEFVGFDKGDYVRKGQEVARVGTDLYQAALDEAEASLKRAEATYEKAQQLFEREAVPRQELIDATGDFEVRKAQVAQSRLRLERSKITAPISGLALTRDLEPGEVLAPGAPITTLQRVDRLKAVIGIPETDIAMFKVGGDATLTVDAFPDRTFTGRISFVGPATEASSRTFPAEIAVANGDGTLKPGMIARVSLVRRSFENAIVVPRDVLHERDAGTVAVVMENGVARVRTVTLDASEDGKVVVTSGLAAGDQLIVEGQRGLVDGQPVRVVETAQ